MSHLPHSDAVSNKPATRRRRPFRGYDMAMILVVGFAVVIVVNILMATLASRTFGGTVVANSYVASQKFNGWLAEAARSRSLGWQIVAQRRADSRIEVQLDGAPAGTRLTALARHPLGRQPDVHLSFRAEGPQRFVSDLALPEGRWLVRFDAQAGERRFRVEEPVT